VGPRAGLDAGEGEEKKSLNCPRRELKTGRPATSLVFTLTKLSRLLLIDLHFVY